MTAQQQYKQSSSFGSIMRRESEEEVIVGKMEGVRNRGRQMETILNGLIESYEKKWRQS